MNTRILPALKACLTDGLADLHLLGQTAEGDAVQPVQVFIGDLPPPENGRKPFPCVILVPVSGHHEEGGETAVIALICCVYNPEPATPRARNDLAILMSASPAYSEPAGDALERRFQLVPDHRGRLLAWEKAETNPKPFLQAAMLSHWTMKAGNKRRTYGHGQKGENRLPAPRDAHLPRADLPPACAAHVRQRIPGRPPQTFWGTLR